MIIGTQRVNSQGHLEVGGCDAVELARQFGTPLYVLDEEALRGRCREYRAAFESRYPNSEISYAGKALLTTAVCRIIEQEELSLDVASAGELFTALHAGFPVERIFFHGSNKSRCELEMAISARIGCVVVDNLLEIGWLCEIADRHETGIRVLLRVSPGVDPKTHRFIRTGQADTKFGLGIANGAAMEGVKRILNCSRLRLEGFHCHVGSQLLDCESQIRGAEALVRFSADVEARHGYKAQSLNVGGGIGIRYEARHQPPTPNEYAEALVGAFISALRNTKLGEPRLVLEPGRAIVGEAGVTLYTVGAIKTVPTRERPGQRMYVSVDGGLSDNPRPTMYGATYTAVNASRAADSASVEVTISGKHCETDTLIQTASIASPESGDILATLSTGAYNHSMASNYNRYPRPAMALVSGGRADLIVERETLEDMVRHDVIPDRLMSLTTEQRAAETH